MSKETKSAYEHRFRGFTREIMVVSWMKPKEKYLSMILLKSRISLFNDSERDFMLP